MVQLRPCLLTKSISERPCMRSYPAKSAGFSPRAVKAKITEFSVDLLLSSCPCSFIFSLTYFSTSYKYASSASSDRPVPERARPITTHSPPTEFTEGKSLFCHLFKIFACLLRFIRLHCRRRIPIAKTASKAISTMILPESTTFLHIHTCVFVAPSSFYYTNILLLARGCCQWNLIFH